MIIHEFTGRVDLERQMWVLSFRPDFSALNVLEPLQNIRFVLYSEKNLYFNWLDIYLLPNCQKSPQRKRKKQISWGLLHMHPCIKQKNKEKKKLFLLNWWSKVNEMAWPCFRGQLFWSRRIPLHCFIEIENFGRVFQKHLTLTELCSYELIFSAWPM